MAGAMMVEPTIVSLANNHAVATWNNVVIQVWEHPLDASEQLVAMHKTRSAFLSSKAKAKAERKPLLAITVVSEHANMPDAESRNVAKDFPEYFDYYVGVHEGAGFRASLVRAVLVGLALAARVRTPHEICSDLVAGAAKLSARSEGTVAAGELVEVVRDLRARIAAQRS